MEPAESAYITSVHLKGYKSIRDVSVTLNKGLNILIGANGSGKTNFLEFLDAACRGDYEKLLNGGKFESEIVSDFPILKMRGERVFQKNISYRVERNYGEDSLYIFYLNDEMKIIKNESSDIDIPDILQTEFLKFDNPLPSILKNKLSLTIRMFSIKDKLSPISLGLPDIMTFIELKNNTQGIYSFIDAVFDRLKNEYKSLSSLIENQPFDIDELQLNLRTFSPIKEIKIDWELIRKSIQEDEHGQMALIEGIDFQFYVNNEWVNWTQLSDGTKRLFYLIGSVTYATENEIILIEEPELGVHPHQLALLMNFLKSESEDKQIIISTHSPQVLNCLKGEELDRIIVARHEGKAGTKLYHLSEEEKGYASEFMEKEAFLSDYWMLSGFMNEEMPEDV